MSLATQTPTIRSSRPAKANDVIAITSAATAAGVSVKHYGDGIYRTAVFTFTNASISWVDNAGSGGYAALQLGDWPLGLLDVRGALVNFTAVNGGAGIGASGTLKYSLGTAAEATGDTLDSTQADLLASTSIALSSSAGTSTAATTAGVISNGSVTAKDLYLNFGASAGDSTANGTLTVTGTIDITYGILGAK